MNTIKTKRNLVLLIDFAVIIASFFAKPLAAYMIYLLPDCPFNKFSLLCPSCGGTRAVFNLFSGNFSVAFHYNQFFVLLCIYLISVMIFANLGFLFKIQKAQIVFKKIANYKVIIALAFLWLTFGILRNLF